MKVYSYENQKRNQFSNQAFGQNHGGIAVTLFIILAALATYQAVKYKIELRAIKQLDTVDTDEGLLSLLEISDAPIATKMLKAAAETKDEPEWAHTSSVYINPAIVWRIFNEDMALESGETEKLGVVKTWIKRGVKFTHYESLEIAKMFNDVSNRAMARDLLSIQPKQAQSTTTDKQPQNPKGGSL